MTGSYEMEVLERAREVASAIFRVAGLVRHPKLKSELTSAAVELVARCGEIPYLPYIPAGASLPYLPYIENLSGLVKLAEAVGEMKLENANVLNRELKELYSAIAESTNVESHLGEIDLSNDFKEAAVISNNFIDKEPNLDQKERQSAILSFIRQLPNGCRMKDLIRSFSSVSERTLRNDLQILISERVIERIGSQGPNSYFRVLSQVTRSGVATL